MKQIKHNEGYGDTAVVIKANLEEIIQQVAKLKSLETWGFVIERSEDNTIENAHFGLELIFKVPDPSNFVLIGLLFNTMIAQEIKVLSLKHTEDHKAYFIQICTSEIEESMSNTDPSSATIH